MLAIEKSKDSKELRLEDGALYQVTLPLGIIIDFKEVYIQN